MVQIRAKMSLLLLLGWLPFGGLTETLSIVTETLPPFQIVQGKEITGIATKRVRELLNKVGVDYTIKAHPWHISYSLALKTPNTCIYSISRTAEREPLFQWIGKLAEITPSFYTSVQNAISIVSLSDAKQHKTAVLRDDLTHQFLVSKGFKEDLHLYVSESYDSLFNLLDVSSRGIDLVISNDLLVQERFSMPGQKKRYRKVMDLNELRVLFYLACNKETSLVLVDKLQKGL